MRIMQKSKRMARLVSKQLCGLSHRLDVAALLMAVALGLLVIGSLFPQLPREVEADPVRAERWERAVRRRYGERSDIYFAVRGFTLGRSPLTWLPLGLCAVATVTCTTRRTRRIWRGVRQRSATYTPETLVGAPYHGYIQTTRPTDDIMAHLGIGLERQRLRAHWETAGATRWLRAERHPLSRLASPLLHTAVLLILGGALVTALTARRVEVTLAPGETIALDERSGLALRHDAFIVERDRYRRPTAYLADLTLLSGNGNATSARVAMNQPLTHSGWHVTIQDYWGAAGEERLVLLASRDPGFLPVAAGGTLLTLGMFVAVYWPRVTLRARLGADGELLLAAWPSRHAWAFDAKWAEIVALARDAAREPEPPPTPAPQADTEARP